MDILSKELRILFTEAASKSFPEFSTEELMDMVRVEDPKKPEHGHYACSVAFKLAKRFGKDPKDLADEIIGNFPKDYRVESLSFAAPSYINVKLSPEFFREMLNEMEDGFSVLAPASERPIIVEYPSTNAAKHLGVHHVITTFLGDALANLLEFTGNDVIRINHLGDWGTHFGKLIYAMDTWGDKKEIQKHPNDELTRLYVKFHEEAEKNPGLEDKARAIFKQLEEGDEERMATWKWIVTESNQDLQKLMTRLGVEVDHIMGESFYLKLAEEVIEDGLNKGLFIEGEGGALIFKMGEDETPALIRKGDGTTLYLTRDVATIRYRVETWHPASILYVVDVAQALHFKQNFAVARAIGYAEDTNLEHIVFGRMRFADRAMSTRKGIVIRLEALLEEAVKRAGLLAAEKGTELPRAELHALAEQIGIASVKYAVLSQDRQKDIVFDWDKIITLEGNSAPYLLYSYARARGIVDKVGPFPLSGKPRFSVPEETQLLLRLLKLPDALTRAAEDRKPHVLATALYELCQEFNRFYSHVRVAEADTEDQKRTRLGLVMAFMHALRACLAILGIPTTERM